MLTVSSRSRGCWMLPLILAVLCLGETRETESEVLMNSIKSLEPLPALTNRSSPSFSGVPKKSNTPGQGSPCSSDKECLVGTYCHSPQQAPARCLSCRRRKKRCHRDRMCCPGNRCSNDICIPESILSSHKSSKDEHKKFGIKEKGWRRNGKPPPKISLKGHGGDPCLRSSDCTEGYCCARHFWTKICKPVLQQGEVCTKQRKKGSHGLEIFQRCDCAKGLACKVWKDATSFSKSRLNVCQKI
ncbi:hypothetical protein DNTS_006067 [Danionella cerebrum]|uniref:Uncharacterized protein n=1 Tax=Danionella cerebrum TaxID=2873325 RepID=A0A553NLB4_9TELE|nr:hypothetical protein DNTS_006067 [Danionella translucida]TRY66228.1 hypothetical protein DNTS_006067 [Danionella translucida]